MSEFRRILMSSFLMLLLHFPAAAVKYYSPIVRAGDEVTLPFDNVIDDQDKCESTEWLFSCSGNSRVKLFKDGQIHNDSKAKSDRLNVTENCSLVIKKVTEEDAGYYRCSQFNKSGEHQGPESVVILYVVTMTGHLDTDEVTLNCSVVPYVRCRHRVKWLLQGQDVDTDHREIKTSQSLCSASVTFLTSLFSYTTRFELFTCQVTDDYTREVHLFPVSAQSSGPDSKHPEGPAVWWVIMVPVGLAALIITVVTVHIWTRAKGDKKRMTKNLEQNDEDEDEDEVNDENDGGASTSV